MSTDRATSPTGTNSGPRFLVAVVVFVGLVVAVVVTLLLVFFFALLWFALPLRYRGANGD